MNNQAPILIPAGAGRVKSIQLTLSAAPGTVTTVTLPDLARGFRIYPHTNPVRFAVGESPVPGATAGTATVAAAALGAGSLAQPDNWETRLLDIAPGRTLGLLSSVASVVVDLETF